MSNISKTIAILFALLLSLAPPTSAIDSQVDQDVEAALQKRVRLVTQMAMNDVVLEATRSQNNEHLTPAEIRDRDNQWKASRELTEFKTSLQTSDVGKLFANKINWPDSVYSEMFLTDNQGANVAAYPATSDYWQGDEEKWIASFNRGSGRVFIGPIELDESTGIRAVQISVPVLDGEKTIGVLIVGVKLSFVVESMIEDRAEQATGAPEAE
ncbi:MAG: cache domain-containing protein [Deltaproteobacteria bacterium]|nr:cache domain-containing protein [Deltaproteobacteria bacterium]